MSSDMLCIPPPPPPPPDGPCYFQGQDYKVDGCGYADTLSIIDNRTDTDASSWFNGPRSVVVDLAHPSQCQALCAAFTGCAFFSFEIQQSSPEAKCYLKAAYSDPSCVGYSMLAPSNTLHVMCSWLWHGIRLLVDLFAPACAGVWDDCGDGAGTCWSGPGVCPSVSPTFIAPPSISPPPSQPSTVASLDEVRTQLAAAPPGSNVTVALEPGITMTTGGLQTSVRNDIHLDMSLYGGNRRSLQEGLGVSAYAVIDALNLSRHFFISNGASLTLRGVHLLNGTHIDGGSLFILGSAYLTDVNISKCAVYSIASSPASGGAMTVTRKGYAECVRCNIWGCHAVVRGGFLSSDRTNAFGGAIYVLGWQHGSVGYGGELPGHLLLRNCKIFSCSAETPANGQVWEGSSIHDRYDTGVSQSLGGLVATYGKVEAYDCEMWDGHVRCLRVRKCRMELIPDTRGPCMHACGWPLFECTSELS
jgi:hypothetical protein